MSNKIWLKFLIPLILGLSLPFVFLYFMFETMGISEYVWPILFPILSTTFGILAVILVIAAIACKVSSGTVSQQSTLLFSSSTPPSSRPNIPSSGASYVIPLYCPHCMNQIELNKVEWLGSSELTCPRCYNTVHASVQEDL